MTDKSLRDRAPSQRWLSPTTPKMGSLTVLRAIVRAESHPNAARFSLR